MPNSTDNDAQVAEAAVRRLYEALNTGDEKVVDDVVNNVIAHQTNGTHLSAHGIGKGAVASFAPHLAVEGGPSGIRVNTISPGLTRTNQTERFITGKDDARTPLGRVGTAEDVAYVALFLASDDSRWVTGANIIVDGGQHILMPPNR